jgi:hypothetical protein
MLMNLTDRQIRALISKPETLESVKSLLGRKILDLSNLDKLSIDDLDSLKIAAADTVIGFEEAVPVRSYKTRETEDTQAFNIHIHGIDGCYVFFVDECGIEGAFDTLEEAECNIITIYEAVN